MRIFLMGAAAIALAASGAIADPGKGNGGGNGHGNGGAKAAAGPSMNGGQGHGNKGNGKQAKADRGQPARLAQGKADHAPVRAQERKADRPAKSENRGNAGVKARANGNGNGNGNGNAKAERVRVVKDKARDVREVRQVREVRIGNRDDNGPRIVRTVARFDPRGQHGLIDGCPPGLAKKHNGCMPPGLAKARKDYRVDYRSYDYRPSWFGYDGFGDGRYRYGDGYLYRMNDAGSILGYIPLLGGALSIGNQWPSYYEPVQVPDYYVDYYNLGAPGSYRYADDVLYRVDPQSDAITAIAALLTGDQFAVGQRMPAGYDVYNVPYEYRDRYYDTPQYDYRYADGYIYQVDPTTQLIAAAIQLLT
jgi:hypothetical protein